MKNIFMWGMVSIFLIYLILEILFIPRFRKSEMEKQRKDIDDFQNKIKVGDNVLTMSGIYGAIVSIRENIVMLKVDTNTTIKINKASIISINK